MTRAYGTAPALGDGGDELKRHRLLILAMGGSGVLTPLGLSTAELSFLQTRTDLFRSVFRPQERNFGFVLTKGGEDVRKSFTPQVQP